MLNISKLKNLNIKNTIRYSGEITNEIKHRPAFTKEWFNSVYNYNYKNMKNIPSLDLTVARIITNYFNMFCSSLEKSLLINKKTIFKRKLNLNRPLIAKPEFKHTNDKVIITLYVYNRELSIIKKKMIKIRRLFLAEYYHRIVVKNILAIKKITVLKKFGVDLNDIKKNIKNITKKIFFLKKKLSLKSLDILKKIAILRIRLPKWAINNSKSFLNSRLRFLKKRTIYNKFSLIRKLKFSLKSSFFTQIKLNKFIQKRIKSKLNYHYKLIEDFKIELNKFKNQYRGYLRYLNKEKLYKRSMRKVKFLNKADRLLSLSKVKETYKVVQNLVLDIFGINKSLDLKKYNIFTPKFNGDKYLYYLELLKVLHKMRLYLRYNRLIAFNKFKFNIFINPLKQFLESLYKKNVEFNIITLKSYHLNSNLLTKVITNRLKNRKNSALKIIKSVLSRIKMPVSRKLDYLKEIPLNKHIQNIILKNYLNNKFFKKKPVFNKNLINNKNFIKELLILEQSDDKLNMVLKSIFNPQKTLVNKNGNMDIQLRNRRIKNIVLDTIKNKNIGGIRIEASGRLTKKVAAARSLFKMKQKGTIRNINSSYKKISSLLLRGNLKSNTQYTFLNNKTRVGSFGIKGWISSV